VSDAFQPDGEKPASNPVQPDSDKPAGRGRCSRKQHRCLRATRPWKGRGRRGARERLKGGQVGGGSLRSACQPGVEILGSAGDYGTMGRRWRNEGAMPAHSPDRDTGVRPSPPCGAAFRSSPRASYDRMLHL
jgi:hypothetical protein